MATRQRLRELAHADLERECAMFERQSGDVVVRIASLEELRKYRAMAEQARKRGTYYERNTDTANNDK